MTKEYQNYYRCISGVIEQASSTECEFLNNCLSRQGFSDIKDFLNKNFHTLHDFWKPGSRCLCGNIGIRRGKPILTTTQWFSLFITDSTCPCFYIPKAGLTVNNLDVTLVSFLIVNLVLNEKYYQTLPDIQIFLEKNFHQIFELNSFSSSCKCGQATKGNVSPPLNNKEFLQLYDVNQSHPCGYTTNTTITRLPSSICTLFGGHLNPQEKIEIENIRIIRNSLVHASKTQLTDTEFNSTWGSLKQSIDTIASLISNTYKENVSKEMDILEVRSLDDTEAKKLLKTVEHFKDSCLNTLKTVETTIKEQEETIKTQGEIINDLLTMVKFTKNEKRRNMIAKTQQEIDYEVNRLSVDFVKTNAYKNVVKTLEMQRYVIIKGNPGDGKSTLAVNAIKTLTESGKQPLRIYSSVDWDEVVAPNENLIIFIENIFGEHSVSENDFLNWSNRIRSLESIKIKDDTNAETCNFLVVTIRTEIYNECIERIRDKSFFKSSMIDISSGEHVLTESEIKNILQKYLPPVLFEEVERIDVHKIFKECSVGFPECCRMFKDNEMLHSKGLSFFYQPSNFHKTEFMNLFKDGNMKLAVYIYILMCGGKAPSRAFRDNEIDAELKRRIIDTFVKGENRPCLFNETVGNILGCYIKFDEINQYYEFSHSSIQSSLFLAVGKHCIQDIVKRGDIALLKFLKTSRCTNISNEQFEIGENSFSDVFDRILRCLRQCSKIDFSVISELNLWSDNNFYKMFLAYIFSKSVTLTQHEDEDGKSLLVHFAFVRQESWMSELFKNTTNDRQRYLSLNAACEGNQENNLQCLLELGVIPDTKSCFHALKIGALNTIERLRKHGADVMSCCSSLVAGYEPHETNLLAEAILSKQRQLVTPLLELYPDLLHTRNSEGLTVLHCAALVGDKELIELFVNKGMNPCIESKQGLTILHYASLGGNIDIVKTIVVRYPKLLLTKHCLWGNPLHMAALNGHRQIIQYLIDIISNCIKTPATEILSERNSEGITVLHHASYTGNVELFNFLVEKGVSVSCKTNNKKTMLHLSCMSGKLEMCEYIVNNFTELLHDRSDEGGTVLHDAACSGNVELFKFLVDKGVDPLLKMNNNSTVLLQGCFLGQFEMCKYIIKNYNQLLSERDSGGSTVLHAAAYSGNVELFRFLVDKGLNVSCKMYNNNTVLHQGCLTGKLQMCIFIVNHYPELLEERDSDGRTVLHYAADSGNVELFRYLVDKNVSVLCKMNDKKDCFTSSVFVRETQYV